MHFERIGSPGTDGLKINPYDPESPRKSLLFDETAVFNPDMARHENIDTLTGLRAVAAFWVFFGHVSKPTTNTMNPGFAHRLDWGILDPLFHQGGGLGVDIFFVLSGFVLTHVYSPLLHTLDVRRLLGFYSLRLGRILPIHFVIIVLVIVLNEVGLMWSKGYTWEQVALNLTLMQIFTYPTLNLPSWSVSAEWVAYLCFPFILQQVNANARGCNPFYLIILLVVLYIMALTAMSDTPIYYGSPALIRVFCGVTIGICVYRLYTMEPRFHWRIKPDILALLTALAFYLTFAYIPNPKTAGFLFVPFLIYFIATSDGLLKSILASKPMIFLGTISYSFYLLHYPAISLFKTLGICQLARFDALSDQTNSWIQLLLLTCVLIVTAWAAYSRVESPSRKLVKRRVEKAKPFPDNSIN